MILITFTMCSAVDQERYLENAPIITVPVILHLYAGQTFEEIKKSLVNSRKILLKGKIVIEIISVEYNASELDGVYDVDTTRILDEKSISDRDQYLHIFFVKKLINSEKETYPVGYHISWSKDKCSSFILISDDASISTIAHEIGHELGLDHVREKRINKKNIMYPIAIKKRISFSRGQILKMRTEALKRNTVCKAKFQGLKI